LLKGRYTGRNSQMGGLVLAPENQRDVEKSGFDKKGQFWLFKTALKLRMTSPPAAF
jgi:hypothetical protein